MNTISYCSGGYRTLVQYVKKHGQTVVVGSKETREITNAHFAMYDPIDRVVTDPARNLNFAFAIAEWVSTMTGEASVSFYTKFIKNYARFSSDGKTIDGVYGTRIVAHDQINGVIDELKRDRLTRRAVIAIYEGNDLHGGGGKNTPCTLNLQFLVRDNALNLIATMRSNDVWLGLPYDVFNFTMIQEFIATQIGVPVGIYCHNAGSFHIYSDNYSDIAKLGESRWPHKMPKMPSGFNIDDVTYLRECGLNVDNMGFFKSFNELGSQYARDLALIMRSYVLIKSSPDEARYSAAEVKNITFRQMARMLLAKAGIVKKMEKLKLVK